MLAKLARTAAIALIATAPAARAVAQDANASQFQTGAYYVGPRFWLGNLNGALALGGQVEKALTPAGAYGPGIIAGGAGVDFYSWSNDYGFGTYKYSVVPVQAFGNYHFVIENNRKLDPYVGLALVYSIVNSSWSGTGTAVSADASWLGFAGQAGMRYFMSDNLALQGQIGFGYGTLGLGAAWKF